MNHAENLAAFAANDYLSKDVVAAESSGLSVGACVHDTAADKLCKLCEKVCPSEAIEVKSTDKKAEIETSICLQCTNCQQVYPKDSIHYSK